MFPPESRWISFLFVAVAVAPDPVISPTRTFALAPVDIILLPPVPLTMLIPSVVIPAVRDKMLSSSMWSPPVITTASAKPAAVKVALPLAVAVPIFNSLTFLLAVPIAPLIVFTAEAAEPEASLIFIIPWASVPAITTIVCDLAASPFIFSTVAAPVIVIVVLPVTPAVALLIATVPVLAIVVAIVAPSNCIDPALVTATVSAAALNTAVVFAAVVIEPNSVVAPIIPEKVLVPLPVIFIVPSLLASDKITAPIVCVAPLNSKNEAFAPSKIIVIGSPFAAVVLPPIFKELVAPSSTVIVIFALAAVITFPVTVKPIVPEIARVAFAAVVLPFEVRIATVPASLPVSKTSVSKITKVSVVVTMFTVPATALLTWVAASIIISAALVAVFENIPTIRTER